MGSDSLGKEAFREGLSIYLNRFRYQNTTTEDLWDCLSEGSHLDIRALMDKYIILLPFLSCLVGSKHLVILY